METPEKKRRVLVVIGSASDRPGCEPGIALLKEAHEQGKVEYLGCVVASIHRNTLAVLALACLCLTPRLPRRLRSLALLLHTALEMVSPDDAIALDEIAEVIGDDGADVVVTGAGKANHLSGTFEAFLRHSLRSTELTTLGVALPGKTDQANEAAWLSMVEVPGTGLVLDDETTEFRGADGFAAACRHAVNGEFDHPRAPHAPKAVEFER